MSYFNNHNHTDVSNVLLGFPDVICKIPDLIQRAYDLGLNGLSISEHEGLSSHVEALSYYNKMNKERPFILGLANEIYLVAKDEDNLNREIPNSVPYYHFVLTALDTEGHHQLRLLSTRAWLRAWRQGRMYRRPTYYSDLEEIVKTNQGHIIASTACLGSRIDKFLLQEYNNGSGMKQAFDEVARLQSIFGCGNLYLEVQPAKDANSDQSHVNTLMWELHKKTGVPIIPTTDSHYLRKEDAFIHKVYLQSQEGDREVDDFYATAYLMDEAELREYLQIDFNDTQIDQMFEWSCELGQRIKEYNILHDPIIPQIPVDKIPNFHISHIFRNYYDKYPYFAWYSNREEIHEQYFFSQVEQGLQVKIVNKGKSLEQYIARLDEEWKELKIISEQLNTSMASYYSTMSEIIELIWQAGSLSMPARGSAAGFLTCYLLDVTQIDPVPLGDYMPSWRHLNHERGVELADIDNDSEASKKKAIVNKMKDYFGEDKVLNVATFATISSKTALDRACRGLGIDTDTSGFLKSLIPVNRGKVAKLKDCIYGNSEKGVKPVYELVNELKKYPDLIEVALGMEGLKTNRGLHAAGVTICNSPYTDYVSAMRSPDGTLSTSYNLWDDEASSLVKMDMLTVEAADKIHKTMDYLLKYGKIEWQGSLKETYNKYLHPDVLEYNDPKMWEILPTIYSVFQFDTPISSKTLTATRPHSVMDLSAANSLLRLQPDNADETPIDRYIRYKQNHQAWIDDTIAYGLNDDERAILWKYLSDAYGLADSQEKIMRLSMDEHTSGYTLKEANKLRNSIARKDENLQAEAKQLFFDCCNRQGTRPIFADYIWNVVFAASMGYSFSQLHSFSYSIIALQEMNLNYFYPRVYWNCACLSTEASGEAEGDKTATTDYGKVAKAIYKMKESNIEVSPPSINDSDNDFTPREADNTILFGIAGISGINPQIAEQIISLRPYTSFTDFYSRNTFEGSLVTKSKFIQLIKGGCFDEFCQDRTKVMRKFIMLSTPEKKSLTTANLPEIIALNLPVPNELLTLYQFKKQVCVKENLMGNHPNFKSKKVYRVDDDSTAVFNDYCRDCMEEGVDWWNDGNYTCIVDKSIDKYFKPEFDQLKEYINTPEFLKKYNKAKLIQAYNESCPSKDPNKWSFQALSYYSREHELAHIDYDKYGLTRFKNIPEEPVFETKKWGNREWKQYELYRICGVVLSKNDNNHLLTLLTPENNVISVKFNGGKYAYYKQQISVNNKVMDKPWFTRGNLLMVVGYRRGESDFVNKSYKSSIFPSSVSLIEEVNKDRTVVIRNKRYMEDEEE